MHRVLLALVITAVMLVVPAAAQEQDAMSRWGESTLDKLERFLPNAAPWGFAPEVAHTVSDFKAFANDTLHRYPALVTHKTWYFNDPGLSHQLDEIHQQKEALKKEMQVTLDEFTRVHGAEMEALNNKHLTDVQSVSQSHAEEINALSKQAQEFFQQGKTQEGKAILDKISAIAGRDQDKLQAVRYAPYEELTSSFKKKQQDLDDRESKLMALRRSVSFRIYTNRTPTTTAFAYPTRPVGTLAGRTLYRQDRGTMDKGSGVTEAAVDLAIYLGPAGFVNPHIKVGEWHLKVKCIIVWAWIESLPDTVQADEATVKKVLEKIDYDGLSKLIEP